jgi:hypothetical protein
MPRDPRDTTTSATEKIHRRLGEADDQKEPIRLRVGAGPAGATGKEGPKGENGTNGTNGATWYSGAGEPEGALGVNGDFYLRTSNEDVYKKIAGSWNIITNLKGETGSTGATGAGGKEGPAGSLENTDWKNSVRCATTANIATATALNPGDILDGVTLVENDRVLVKDQTTKSQNGIWLVKAVPVRATDADAVAELSGGSTIYVEEGTKNKRRTFQVITAGNITPGTTAHEYQQLGFRDFGVVAALPTTEAVLSDKCTYKVETGVYWDLIYTGEATYPWAKIGGPPMRVTDTAVSFRETKETTAQTTGAPSITAPLAMEARARYGARHVSLREAGAPADVGRAELYVNAVFKEGALAAGVDAFEGNTLDKGSDSFTVAAAQAVQTRYRSESGKMFQFYYLFVELDPIRVG